ncbi:MAG: DUF5060 domain-containing protein [Anaerolineae bacterium]|nr:DUF5060 domain-containing protein [Anaerolineae bacterium]
MCTYRPMGQAARLAVASALCLTALVATPPAMAQGGLSIVNLQANTSTVGQYEKFELTFDINGSVATNPYFPYDPTPPPGVPAGVGITVEAVFTHLSSSTVLTQPGFLYQPYERRCVSGGTFVATCPPNGEEWLYPIGAPKWTVRFAPQQLGEWRYVVRARDASGSAQSSVGTFTVVPSTLPHNHGFIRIAQADPGYFEYSDGTPFIGVGHGEGFRGWRYTYDADEAIARLASGRVNFIRTWMSGSSIYMAPWNPWYSHHLPGEGGYFNPTSLTYTHAYSGNLVSLRLWDYPDPGVDNRRNPCMFNGFDTGVAVRPNTTYRLQVRLRLIGVTGPRRSGYPYGFTVRRGGWLGEDCSDPERTSSNSTVLLPHVTSTTGWTVVSSTFTTDANTYYLDNFYLILDNTTGGDAYIDEVSLREVVDGVPSGPEVLRKGRFAYHLYFDPYASWQWDYFLDRAAEHGITVRPVVLEKNDWIANHLDANGNPVGSYYELDNNRFYAAPNTAVRRFHEYYWRYLIARWGYSRGVHSWELINEGDPYNGNHYAMADAFGRFMRQHNPHRQLTTTSHWHSFPMIEFWANPQYDGVDYADIHEYACCGNRYAGWAGTIGGALTLDTDPAHDYDGRGGSVRIPGATWFNNAGDTPRSLAIRGQGEWVIRFKMKAQGFTGSCPYGAPNTLAGPRLLWILDNGQPNSRSNVVPPAPSGQNFVCSAPAGTYGWRQFDSRYLADGVTSAPISARLVITDDDLHHLIIAFQNGFGTGGTAWIDDVELIAPDGRKAYLNGTFDPTSILSDTAHLTAALSQQIGGRSLIGPRKPVTRGEVAVGDDTGYRGDSQHAQVNDTQGVWLHNFVWAQINPGGLYELYWDQSNIIQYNLYFHFKAFRDFMDGVPLNNGRYADARAQTSDLNLIPLGQMDRVAGRAHLWIRHRQFTWWNAINNVSIPPISGTVTLPDVANGIYRVTWWNAWLGQPMTTTAAVATNNALTLTLPMPITSSIALKVDREWQTQLYLPLQRKNR